MKKPKTLSDFLAAGGNASGFFLLRNRVADFNESAVCFECGDGETAWLPRERLQRIRNDGGGEKVLYLVQKNFLREIRQQGAAI